MKIMSFFFKNIIFLLRKSADRTTRVKINITSLFLLRFLNAISVFFMMSVSIDYLGKVGYGVWLAIYSVIAYAIEFDFGISNSLRNLIARMKAKGETLEIAQYISASYVLSALVSVILFVVLIAVIGYVDWTVFLSIDRIFNSEVRSVLYIAVFFFMFSLALKPIFAIFQGYQWPAAHQAVLLMGSILSLVLVSLIDAFDVVLLSTLKDYAIIVSGVPILLIICTTIYLFNRRLSHIKPKFLNLKKRHWNSILKNSLGLFLIQVLANFIIVSDSMIIASLHGVESVLDFNVAFRYFGVIVIISMIIASPIWSATTDAYHQGDTGWISQVVGLLLIGVTLFSVVMSYLFYLGSDYFYSYLSNELNIDKELSLSVAILAVTLSFHALISSVVLGMEKIKTYLYFSFLTAALKVPVAHYLSSSMGVEGVVFATCFCLLILDSALFIQYKKSLEKKKTEVRR